MTWLERCASCSNIAPANTDRLPRKCRCCVPQAPTTSGLERPAGRFVELRSPEGNAVRAVKVCEPGPPTVEFPTGDSTRPFGRAEPSSGAVLSVLVEAHQESTHAALVDLIETGTRGSTEPVRQDDA